jgi:hypothetical protein
MIQNPNATWGTLLSRLGTSRASRVSIAFSVNCAVNFASAKK